jgi:hypothetical protein
MDIHNYIARLRVAQGKTIAEIAVGFAPPQRYSFYQK